MPDLKPWHYMSLAYWLAFQGLLGLIFCIGMTSFRQSAIHQARKLIIPDKQCYDSAWNALLTEPHATPGLKMVEHAVENIEVRCRADTAAVLSSVQTAKMQQSKNDIARQYNRCTASLSLIGQDFERDCGEAGSLDLTRPLNCLDQLYAQEKQPTSTQICVAIQFLISTHVGILPLLHTQQQSYSPTNLVTLYAVLGL
jgi:hypothetical protein